MVDAYDWEGLHALTRQRRAEALERLRSPTARYSGTGSEFSALYGPGHGNPRGRKFLTRVYRAWKKTHYWGGHRNCCYCQREMIMQQGHPTSATLEHKQPLNHPTDPGEDSADNWALACLTCNNKKGNLTEAEFVSILEYEAKSTRAA